MEAYHAFRGWYGSGVEYVLKNAYTLLGIGFIGNVISSVLQGLVAHFVGELRCKDFDAAQTQRCIEGDFTSVSGCGNIHQLVTNISDPNHPVGRGISAHENKADNAVLQVLETVMWYAIDTFEKKDLDCSAFDVRPMSLKRHGIAIIAAAIPSPLIGLILAVYASRVRILRNISRLQEIVSIESLEYEDWLAEVEDETIGARYFRHSWFAFTYLATPLIQILALVLQLLVMSLAFPPWDFIMWFPRTIAFSGLFTGRPLMPLNGWYRRELFLQTGTIPDYYNWNVATDPLISRDSIYQPPTFSSGLAGTDSRWRYLYACFYYPNMPTPLNALFPTQLSCTLPGYGASATVGSRNSICTVEGTAGMKLFIFFHHTIYLVLILAHGAHFFWRLRLLIPYIRRRNLRRSTQKRGGIAADRLTDNLGFPSWLILHFYLSTIGHRCATQTVIELSRKLSDVGKGGEEKEKRESCFAKVKRVLHFRASSDVDEGTPPPHQLELILPGSSSPPPQPSGPPRPETSTAADVENAVSAGEASVEEGTCEGQPQHPQLPRHEQQQEQQQQQQQQQQEEQQQPQQQQQQQTLAMAAALWNWLKLGGTTCSPRERLSSLLAEVKNWGKGCSLRHALPCVLLFFFCLGTAIALYFISRHAPLPDADSTTPEWNSNSTERGVAHCSQKMIVPFRRGRHFKGQFLLDYSDLSSCAGWQKHRIALSSATQARSTIPLSSIGPRLSPPSRLIYHPTVEYEHSSIAVRTPYHITAYQLFAVTLPPSYCQDTMSALLKIGVCVAGREVGSCQARHVVAFCEQPHPYKYFAFPVEGSLTFVLTEGPDRRLDWARELVFAAKMRGVSAGPP